MTSFLTNFAQMKSQLDEVRAQVYPRNDTEKKVYEALSSKNWGASSTLMNEIASETYDYEKYNIIMNILWQNIEGEGKTWKNIFKALTLVEFLIKNGSERVIEAARDKMYRIRSLSDYNFYEGTIDRGSGIREKSKQVVELLSSNEQIRSEREKAKALRSKFVGISNDGTGFGNSSRDTGNYGGSYNNREGSSYGGSYGGRDAGNYGGSYGGKEEGNYGGSASYNSGNGGRYDGDSSSPKDRFGGGAYDSSRPPRFEDDVVSKNKDVNDSFDEDVKVGTVTKVKSSTATEKSGKLKVSIKKVGSTVSSTPAISPTEKNADIDLFGDSEFISAPSIPSKPVDLFDPFVSAPAQAAQPTPIAPSFDPFAPSTQAPVNFAPSAQAHVNFAAAPSTSNFGQQSPLNLFPPAPAPAAYPGSMFQPQQPFVVNSFAPNPMSSFPPQSTLSPSPYQANYSQPAMSQPIMSSQPPAVRQVQYQSKPDSDFGDFESHAPAKDGLAAWGNVGKLVDLSSIKKNEEPKPKASSQYNYGQNSFAGLDGFTSKSQPMAGGSINGMRPAPMQSQPSHLQSAPGYAMGGMTAPLNYGYAPQQPMGFPQQGYPQVPPQGYPQQPAYGGYPQYQQGQQGAPFR